MVKKKILLVDDTVPLLEELSSILEMEDYEVISFSSAPPALMYLNDNKADLLISDIIMPKMSGIEFIRIVRSNKDFADIPIIVLTADNTVLKSNNLDIFNVKALLSKPCNIDKLLCVIQEALND